MILLYSLTHVLLRMRAAKPNAGAWERNVTEIKRELGILAEN